MRSKATTTKKKTAKPKTAAGSLSGPLKKLMTRAKGSDRYDAGEALGAILELGSKAAPAREELRSLVADKEPRRSLYARAVLAVLDDERDAHLDALMVAASGTGDAKSVSRTALWDMPGPLVARAISRAIAAPKPKLREAAVLMASSTVPVRKAVPVATLLPMLDDADDGVRVAAIHAVQMHVAPGEPAKPTATLTPAMRERVAALCNDKSKAVADRAQRFVTALAK